MTNIRIFLNLSLLIICISCNNISDDIDDIKDRLPSLDIYFKRESVSSILDVIPNSENDFAKVKDREAHIFTNLDVDFAKFEAVKNEILAYSSSIPALEGENLRQNNLTKYNEIIANMNKIKQNDLTHLNLTHSKNKYQASKNEINEKINEYINKSKISEQIEKNK